MTAYDLATRYIGIREIDGDKDHPLIRWWASLCFDGSLDVHDETPWCSSFLNGITWELRMPRSKSAMARSWLKVGTPIDLIQAEPENDVVILWRGEKNGPFGHVGLFAGLDGPFTPEGAPERVLILGGNTGDAVAIASFQASQVLGVRRLI